MLEPLEQRLMLTTVSESAFNDGPPPGGQILPAEPLVIVEGKLSSTINENDVDFYRVTASPGQRITAILDQKRATELTPVPQALGTPSFRLTSSSSAKDATIPTSNGDSPDPRTLTPPLFSTFSDRLDSSASAGGASSSSYAEVAVERHSSSAFVVSATAHASATASSGYSGAFAGVNYRIAFGTDEDATVSVTTRRSPAQPHDGVRYYSTVTAGYGAPVPFGYVSLLGNAAVTLNSGTGLGPEAHDELTLEIAIVPLEMQLGLFNAEGDLIAGGDNAFDYDVTTSGDYFIAVADSRDGDFDGDFSGAPASGKYDLTVNIDTTDISVNSAEWRSAEEDGGVTVHYQIRDVPLPQAAVVSFFWATSPSATSGPIAAPSALTDTSVGTHSLVVGGGAFSSPPDLGAYLVIVADPSNEIAESAESNNSTSAAAQFSLEASMAFVPVGDTSLSFRPVAKNDTYEVRVEFTNTSPTPLPATTVNWAEARTLGIAPRLPPMDHPTVGTFSLPPLGFEASITMTAGGFQHNWEWIPSANPLLGDLLDAASDIEGLLRAFAAEIAAALKPRALFSELEEFARLLSDGAVSTERVNHFEYLLGSSEPTLLISGDDRKELIIGVPIFRLSAFAVYLGLGGPGADLIQTALARVAAAAAFSPALLRSIAATAAHALAAGAAHIVAASYYYELAKDPPDPDFDTPVVLDPIALPPEMTTATDIAEELLQLQMEVLSLEQAELRAVNKSDGAQLAGNAEWMASQLTAAARFAGRSAVLQSRGASYYSLLQSLGGGLPSGREEVPAYVQNEGLPDVIRGVLEAGGWSEDQIEQFHQSLLQQPEPLEGSPLSQAEASRITAALKVLSALRYQEQARLLRIEKLMRPVVQLSDEQVAALDQAHLRVEELLARGFPSADLFGAIESHIALAEDLLVETNDPQLLTHLENGYANLVQSQQLAPSVDRFREMVADARAEGMMSQDIATRLQAFLDSGVRRLESGSLGGFVAQFAKFATVVDEARGGGITDEVADRFQGYTSYILSTASADSALAADYDLNGVVDRDDYAFWKQHFGATDGLGMLADGNGNGVVDAADYTVWRDNLGASVAMPARSWGSSAVTTETSESSDLAADFVDPYVGQLGGMPVLFQPDLGNWTSSRLARAVSEDGFAAEAPMDEGLLNLLQIEPAVAEAFWKWSARPSEQKYSTELEERNASAWDLNGFHEDFDEAFASLTVM